ncbi:type II transport protein GspH domain protein [Acinetobacter baumannii Naval-18]|nr:type II transport protein GspH domain protein [Acinetobacter baumannii Naval-18]
MASVELKNTPRILTIHIQKAKYDAIIRHKNVVLCPSSDQLVCNTNWDNRVISFVDNNRNLQHDLNEELLTSLDLNHHYGSMKLQRFGKNKIVLFFKVVLDYPSSRMAVLSIVLMTSLKTLN